MKKIFFLIIISGVIFLFLINKLKTQAECPGGFCPFSYTQSNSSQEDSSNNNQSPHSPRGCPTRFCESDKQTGDCPDDPDNNRYCCCKLETLEELDERIETNPSEVDEPIGFIQKCRCYCYTSPCQDDEECMRYPMDEYERETDKTVCGGEPKKIKSEPLNYQPKTEIVQPFLGSYNWEVGLPFFSKKGETVDFSKEPKALEKLLVSFINWIFNFIGAILFFVIIYSGVIYATSSGNPQKQLEAKERIINALIGLIIFICFYVILNTINPNILKIKSIQ